MTACLHIDLKLAIVRYYTLFFRLFQTYQWQKLWQKLLFGQFCVSIPFLYLIMLKEWAKVASNYVVCSETMSKSRDMLCYELANNLTKLHPAILCVRNQRAKVARNYVIGSKTMSKSCVSSYVMGSQSMSKICSKLCDWFEIN